jgi:hypothetical protein
MLVISQVKLKKLPLTVVRFSSKGAPVSNIVQRAMQVNQQIIQQPQSGRGPSKQI